jgi:FMN phosphatase YigB (HAD superfamily)
VFNTVLFDLDGTLIYMDQDEFLKEYYGMIMNKFPDYPDNIILKATEAGVMKMIYNDGTKTNEEVFWEKFNSVVPLTKEIEDRFNDLYENDFPKLQKYTKINPLARETVKILQEKGYDIAILTNPLFPKVATYQRLAWAGLKADEFKIVTTFDNSKYAKPNILYYQDSLENIGANPKEAIMVGNDVQEDLCIRELGVKTFLVEDNIINNKDLEIITDYRGQFADFKKFVEELPERK